MKKKKNKQRTVYFRVTQLTGGRHYHYFKRVIDFTTEGNFQHQLEKIKGAYIEAKLLDQYDRENWLSV